MEVKEKETGLALSMEHYFLYFHVSELVPVFIFKQSWMQGKHGSLFPTPYPTRWYSQLPASWCTRKNWYQFSFSNNLDVLDALALLLNNNK